MINDFKDIKFYIGPITQNVIDSVIEVANEKNVKFGFCATRRQIDYDSGYVGYTTSEFVKYVRSKTDKVLICRDHSGAKQGKNEESPLYKDINSLYVDIIARLDVIHIDPWKKFLKYDENLRETVNHILYVYSHNPYILFEVGTEEAIFPYNHLDLKRFLSNLKYELGDIFITNVKYAVIQSGTRLQETKNIGKFNLIKLHNMIDVCKEFNILSKEHNGDYLTKEELKIRFDNGLNAINIAPELGVIETKVLIKYIKNDKDFNKIFVICLNGEKWKKWVNSDFDPLMNKKELIEICGHYHNKEIKYIVNIDDEIIKRELKNKLLLYL
jgi:hypothetical protein